MNETSLHISELSINAILTFMRTHSLQDWAPEDYWWFGLMHAWGFPRLFKNGRPITKSALENALLDLDVPKECIKQTGVHTRLTLDHIAFVYRELRTTEGQATLKIAPHIKSAAFNKCSHSFIIVYGSAFELAQYLIDVDEVIPNLKTACMQAYQEGINEQCIRDSKLETLRAFLMDLFKGEIPSSIVDYEIADSTPGAADLIRLTIHDPGTPFWRTRTFEIPYDYRQHLLIDHINSFINNTDYQFGTLEIDQDKEKGEVSPAPHFRTFETEATRLGRFDNE